MDHRLIILQDLKSHLSKHFKDEILRESFTPEELAHREEFIKTLGVMTNSRRVRFQVWLKGILKGSSGREQAS